jgi:hypothetical protein
MAMGIEDDSFPIGGIFGVLVEADGRDEFGGRIGSFPPDPMPGAGLPVLLISKILFGGEEFMQRES